MLLEPSYGKNQTKFLAKPIFHVLCVCVCVCLCVCVYTHIYLKKTKIVSKMSAVYVLVVLP